MNQKNDKYLQSSLVITIVMGLVFFKIKYVEIVFTLCWLVLIVYNFRRNDVLGNALSLENCNSIRGGAAIGIMISYIGLATGSIIQYPNRKVGLLFVGLFLCFLDMACHIELIIKLIDLSREYLNNINGIRINGT